MRDHNLRPNYLFKALSLGSSLLSIDALLISCRTQLGLRPSHFSDVDIRDAFDFMKGRSKLRESINVGEFVAFLRISAAASAPRSKVDRGEASFLVSVVSAAEAEKVAQQSLRQSQQSLPKALEVASVPLGREERAYDFGVRSRTFMSFILFHRHQ